MTSMRGMGTLALTALLVTACAAPPGSEEAAPTQTTPEPSSIACAEMEGIKLPPECIPYDPEALMAANERYKERAPVSEEAFAGFEAKRPEITAAIKALQQNGELSADAVAAILTDEGIGNHVDALYVQEDADGFNFGGAGPTGGCVLGIVSDTEFEMNAVGYVLDGGCTALSGH